MKNIVIEGARGTGKSTVSQWIRENTTNSTLINFTGFNDKGEAGLERVNAYYSTWFGFFHNMKHSDGGNIFIHDRFYFSEMVYSNLYKDYDFDPYYRAYLQLSDTSFDELEVFLLISDKNSEERLTREKSPLFDEVAENAEESAKQQKEYIELMQEIEELKIPGIKITSIVVDDLSVSGIGNIILTESGIKQPA